MTVVITGFGPFEGVLNNPSSEIVDLIEKEGITGCSEAIVTEKLEVTYAGVETSVKRSWMEQDPKLMVHIGVDGRIRGVKLEQRSFRKGYIYKDVNGCVPNDNICSTKSESNILITSIDCKEIASKVAYTFGYTNNEVRQSFNPDRYLCAYCYYYSLSYSTDRSLFIHVPEFGYEFTLEKVTNIIREVIKEVLKTL